MSRPHNPCVWCPLVGLVAMCGLAVVIALLSGCGTLGAERDRRPTDDAQDVTARALCPALPVCEIPWGANAKQLQEALWSCVLEYRALYSQCQHGVAVVPPLTQETCVQNSVPGAPVNCTPLQAVPAEVF